MQPCPVVCGVAIIPVQGVLVHRLGCIQPAWGCTGYDGIRHNLMLALADPAVRAIAFDIDSQGGDVDGLFDLADTIYRARGAKPIWAMVNDTAFSAAYAIASACDRITVPRTGGTGSVGIVCMHVDQSAALRRAGMAVTLIQCGARKADGSEFEPLSDPALTVMQREVDMMGEIFVSTVARNRRLDQAAVRDTEAATYLGADSVALGFADAVMAPDEAFRSLLQQLGPMSRERGRRSLRRQRPPV
jgi:ClpP class serine protease